MRCYGHKAIQIIKKSAAQTTDCKNWKYAQNVLKIKGAIIIQHWQKFLLHICRAAEKLKSRTQYI